MFRLLAGVMTLALGTTVATAAQAAPRPPAPKPQYVALGDSFAAGVGAGVYLADGTDCHRSLLGYPARVATSGNLALNLQACSGAVVSDVVASQLGTLSSRTAYVTITIGGNDIGFSDIVSTCAGLDEAACLAAVTAGEQAAAAELPDDLTALFAAVKGKANNAQIVATSYPQLFTTGKYCPLFTPAERTRLNDASRTLAGIIEDAANDAGIGYADISTKFAGHAVCDPIPWVNGLTIPQYASFHPNALGYRYGYTPQVSSSLGIGTKVASVAPAPLTFTTGGQTSTDTTRGEVQLNAG